MERQRPMAGYAAGSDADHGAFGAGRWIESRRSIISDRVYLNRWHTGTINGQQLYLGRTPRCHPGDTQYPYDSSLSYGFDHSLDD